MRLPERGRSPLKCGTFAGGAERFNGENGQPESPHQLAGAPGQAAIASLGVERFDQHQQPGPRHHLLHLCQKALAPGLFTFAGVLGIGKAHLGHAAGLGLIDGTISANRVGLVRRFLSSSLTSNQVWTISRILESFCARLIDFIG